MAARLDEVQPSPVSGSGAEADLVGRDLGRRRHAARCAEVGPRRSPGRRSCPRPCSRCASRGRHRHAARRSPPAALLRRRRRRGRPRGSSARRRASCCSRWRSTSARLADAVEHPAVGLLHVDAVALPVDLEGPVRGCGRACAGEGLRLGPDAGVEDADDGARAGLREPPCSPRGHRCRSPAASSSPRRLGVFQVSREKAVSLTSISTSRSGRPGWWLGGP